MNCERNICYQQDYNCGCDTCPCNDELQEYKDENGQSMTDQEIIEQLKSLKSHCEDFREDEGSVWAKDVEALGRAIKALGKQVPKEPTYEGNDTGSSCAGASGSRSGDSAVIIKEKKMPEGIIVVEIPEIPENCFECRFLNSTHFCPHIREHVEYWIIKGARHPKCPIRPVPGKKSIKNSTSITGAYIQKYAEGYNDCIDEILGGK